MVNGVACVVCDVSCGRVLTYGWRRYRCCGELATLGCFVLERRENPLANRIRMQTNASNTAMVLFFIFAYDPPAWIGGLGVSKAAIDSFDAKSFS
jgi:hypothetical protein